MNATALKTFAVLVPACLLLVGSAVLFSKVRTDVRLASKATYPTRGTTSAFDPKRTCHPRSRASALRRCKLVVWSLHLGYRHYLHDFYPSAGHLQMRMVFAEYLRGRLM